MSDAKHTPGPWSYAPAVPGAKRSFYISGNHDANNREVDIGTVQGGYYSCEANARLIAAAPDLLEALSEAVLHVETLHSLAPRGPARVALLGALIRYRNAIAKAESTP